MKLIEKHKLPQASNGLWLKDLAQAIRPLSDTMCLMYSNQASDVLQNKSGEYCTIAMQIREHFPIPIKKPPMARGSAFGTEFNSKASTDGDSEQKLRGRGGSRKRARTRLIKSETSPTKKAVQKCPACNVKGHNL